MGKLLKEMLEKEDRSRLINKLVGATSLGKNEAIEIVAKIPGNKIGFVKKIYENYGVDQFKRYVKYVIEGKKDV